MADRFAPFLALGALAIGIVSNAHVLHLLLDAHALLVILFALAVHDFGHRFFNALFHADRGTKFTLFVKLANLDPSSAVASIVHMRDVRFDGFGGVRWSSLGRSFRLNRLGERAFASVTARPC